MAEPAIEWYRVVAKDFIWQHGRRATDRTEYQIEFRKTLRDKWELYCICYKPERAYHLAKVLNDWHARN